MYRHDTPSISDLQSWAEKSLDLPFPLHQYQWNGVAFLYKSRCALLADEMGLGKTVQTAVAIALLLRHDPKIRRVLIVAPASLTLNWITELQHWVPDVPVRLIQGDMNDRRMYYLLPIPVLVTSYEQIRMDILDWMPPDKFDLVVLDEAQRIKNLNSATSLACRLLPRRRSWSLSATPLENNFEDIVSIMRFLAPSMYRATPVELRSLLRSSMLRRRKTEVHDQVAPVLIQDIPLALSEPQRQRYDEIWSNRNIYRNIRNKPFSAHSSNISLFALLTRLKILCNYDDHTGTSSKFDALQTIFENAEPSARIIVFSQYVDTLRWISPQVNLEHDLLVGGTSATARQKAVDNFLNGPTPRVLFISIKAGGVGLNLQSATHVVLFDRWWNPAVEIQAIYRAHRFDREEPLHVIRFLVSGTIEERIAQILEEKQELFDELIEKHPSSPSGFSRSELLSILSLTPVD